MRWTIIFAVLALAGCTEAQRYTIDVGQRAQAALGPWKECQRGVEHEPDFARVYQKLAVSTVDDPFREPTAAQLSDRAIISDGEKLIVLNWYAETQTCATPTIEELSRLAPEVGVYFADGQADQVDILNEYTANRHTFGEANAAISALKARIKVRASQLGADMQARFVAWDQQEREQTAENVGYLIGYVAISVATRGRMSITHLANRQVALARVQTDVLRMHPLPEASVRRVRTVQCDGLGRTLRCALR